MTLQNVTMTTLEIDWQRTSLINMPSCIVILANTEGRQLLLVESNKAFSKKELSPVTSVKVADDLSCVEITMADKSIKKVTF